MLTFKMLIEFTHKMFGSVIARADVRCAPDLNLAIYSILIGVTTKRFLRCPNNRCGDQIISVVIK